MSKTLWTEELDEAIRRHYPLRGVNGVFAVVKGYMPNQIKYRAACLGVRLSKHGQKALRNKWNVESPQEHFSKIADEESSV